MPDSPSNLAQFQRAALTGLVTNPRFAQALEAYVYQALGHDVDPAVVSEGALERMKRHPVVYLAERIATGVIRRLNTYSVEHEDPKIVKEVEEWLWPLLPVILRAHARAYAYGARGLVFDWGRETLKIEVPKASGEGTRSKSLKEHTHYVSAHSVRRSDFEPDALNDELRGLTYAGNYYASDRAFVLVWDPEDEDDWWGQGARRRAWRDYCADVVLDQLEANYLERSVDAPRVAYAPDGKFEIDGEVVEIPHYVNQLLMTLRGSGVVTFPSDVDDKGNPKYRVDTLDVPDREDVWSEAISRRTLRIMWAYLALIGDGTAAAAKTLDGLLKEMIQDIAEWVGNNLTMMVEAVHRVNYDADKVKPPEVKATDIGKTQARKLLTEILTSVSAERAGRWVDVSKALDQLGVPVLDVEDGSGPDDGQPGRPRDMTGDREERREDARTDEGEDDTGGGDPGRDEQQEEA